MCVRGEGEGGSGGGGGVGSRSHSCFPDDLTLQMQALNLLEKKLSAKHDFVRYCVLFYWQTNENNSLSFSLLLK